MISLFRNLIPIIVLLTIIHITFTFINKEKFTRYVIYNYLFSLYIVILLYIVTYDGLVSYENNVNLFIFKEIFRYKVNSKLFIQNVIGNILLFVPLGIYIKLNYEIKIFKLIFISIFISCSIELTQLIIGRVFDIDDVLLNLFGSFTGYYIIKNKKF